MALVGRVGHDLNEEKWLQLRRETVGASDVAKAQTGRYGGIYNVVAGKTGYVAEINETNRKLFERGHRHEPVITGYTNAVLLSEGLAVMGNTSQAFIVDDETGRKSATLDDLIVDQNKGEFVAVLEAKTRTLIPGTPMPWDYYHAQVQWQMLVAEVDKALVVVAKFSANDPDHFIGMEHRLIEANDYEQAELVALAETIMRHVDEGTMPTPTADNMTEVRAATSYGDPDSPVRDLTEYGDLIAEYADLDQKLRAVESDLGDVKAQIIEIMGDSTIGDTNAWTVKYSPNQQTLTEGSKNEFLKRHPEAVTFSATKAKEIDPDLFESLKEPVGPRTFKIKPRKTDK